MSCRYCGAHNLKDDHRCCRCGRRLHASIARSAPDTYPIVTATAPAFQPTAVMDTIAPPRKPELVPTPVVRQPSLFGTEAQPHPRASRVIKFEEIAPPGHLMPPPKRRPSERRTKQDIQEEQERQQRLDFQTVSTQTHNRTHSESTLYGIHEVASPLHRFCAAFADFSLIAVAVGMFVAIFYLAGGEVVLNKVTTPVYCAIPLIITFFYRILYCLGRGDSSGLQWLGLRLVDFDGKIPNRRQRWNRMCAGTLSCISGGLGLVWALTDQEELAWHDHISKTFPTPEFTRDASLARKR